MVRTATPYTELPPLVGEAPAFRMVLAQVSQLAPLDRPVLVVGATARLCSYRARDRLRMMSRH